MKASVKKILDKMATYQPGIKVQRFIDFPCPWISWDSDDIDDYIETYGEPNHREILSDEVFIDVDSENIEEGRKHATLVRDKLLSHNIKFKEYESGGDGIHFHAIFPEFDWFFENNSFAEDGKYLLIKYLLGPEVMDPEGIDSHICTTKKKLVQIEFVKHRKGGIKKLVNENIGLNTIPPDFFSILEGNIKKKTDMQKRFETIKQPTNLRCIKYLHGKKVGGLQYFEEARINYRTLFALSAYHYNVTQDRDKTLKILNEWYLTIPVPLRRASRESVNARNIPLTVKSTNGSASCLYRFGLLEELGVEKKICKGCPYYM